jgi:proline dehydrogenase
MLKASRVRASRASKMQRVQFGKDPTIFQSHSLSDLLRTMMVFRVCGCGPIVRNNRFLLETCERFLGTRFTYDVLVKSTVFRQFCAGIDEAELGPALKALSAKGIGPILDYAAEAPVDTSEKAKELTASALEVNMRKLIRADDIEYAPDEPLDANVARFLSCMDTAKATTPEGDIAYAAVKITGLCDPQLLARVSALMLRIRQTWAEYFIPENEGVAPQLEDCREVCGRSRALQPRRCTAQNFLSGLKKLFDVSDEEAHRILDFFDKDGKGYVHYFDYTTILRKAIVDDKHTPPQLEAFMKVIPRLSAVECEIGRKAQQRIEQVVSRAHQQQVRVLIDAEQTYYQMAIDATVRDLQRKYNREWPCVYNTYQAYLKHSYKRVVNDLARSKREGWIFAAKIVRGAYLETERKDAARLGYESPVHDSKEATHAMYDQIASRLMDEVEKGRKIGLLFGTHNAQSLQLLTDRLVNIQEHRSEDELKLEIAFAQLFGMGDHLTLPLARAGFHSFKYVPYGPVKETIFYLQRRAEENSGMLTQATGEWPLLKNEVKRRLFRMQ